MVFEAIVEYVQSLANWPDKFQSPMEIMKITVEEVEAEVQKRLNAAVASKSKKD
jgi:hypothetical protein